ncbi:palmitoyl-acyl carrier protein thioesterase, chloroplastic [Cajanus cajan]|nr:palmitoyl-acyl carrier protein thioesterase, chloroplastic [Cajanus cajan]
MTSMVAPINIGLQSPGNWCNAKKKILEKANPRLNSSCNTNARLNDKRRSSSLMTASSNSSPGVMENVSLAHLTTDKSPNESPFRGKIVQDRHVYKQIFLVGCYQIGPDKTITMETLMNFLQETAIRHICFISAPVQNDVGATHEMELRKLTWIVTRIQVQVQRYSKRGDEIEVDTWSDSAGKNGMRKDWIIKDYYTKEILAKATSTWTLMNTETRRLSKIPDEVRQELNPFVFHKHAIEEIDHRKIPKLNDAIAERFRNGVTPTWNDMDANMHVSNVKYIKWILESVPREVLEIYKMTSITLEFRRECRHSDVLESLSSPSSRVVGDANNNNRKADLEYIHLLRLQDSKAELVRARTEWLHKQNQQ